MNPATKERVTITAVRRCPRCGCGPCALTFCEDCGLCLHARALDLIDKHAEAEGLACTDDGSGSCVDCGVALVLCDDCGAWGYHKHDCPVLA